MISLKKIFSVIKKYLNSDPGKIVIQKTTCHHCASRGIIIYPEIKKDENKK